EVLSSAVQDGRAVAARFAPGDGVAGTNRARRRSLRVLKVGMRLKAWLAVSAVGVSVAGRSADAQEQVLLRISPQVGDTLRMRLDQQTEIVGTRRAGSTESTTPIINTKVMFSRA